MYNTKYISKNFIQKINKSKIVPNIYDDDILASFYDSITSYQDFYNDLDFYRSIFNFQDTILEIASGSGRIFTPLSREGYDIYGIEPSNNMVNNMDKHYQDKIYVDYIENILSTNFPEKFNKIIIPATSISLFSHHQLEKFLEDLKNISCIPFGIYFDINEFDNSQDEKVMTFKDKDEGKFYMSNFKLEDKFIFNVYSARHNILGYSVKYLYTVEQILALLKKHNYKSKIMFHEGTYYMLEGTYNEQ